MSYRIASRCLAALAVLATVLAAGLARAEQVAAAPGAPGATATIGGEQLPAPPRKFGGQVGRVADASKPYWTPGITPPKGAPNVLLIMTDDAGFGVPATFGGVIPTPTLDRVAASGLRYTNFHSTAMGAPTRAALLTGRNHHSVGFGVEAEAATGYPGYNGVIAKDKATIGRILRDNGYRTAWFGKNHNTPPFQASSAGPFEQWPVGMGFEYFYGFMGSETNQWQPANLVRDTTYVHPAQVSPGFNLTTALADEAIAHINELNTLAPDAPFFVYFAPGGPHAPHQPTKEWVDKIAKMQLFDQGWNAMRQQIFENQKRLGVIPKNARLTPWPKDLLREWEQLSANEKKLFIRQAEVFAAYVAYTDNEIGRVIEAVAALGKLDNTLIIYISGDNGTSAEGQLNGTPNEVATDNGVQLPVEDQLKQFYDVWGSDKTYNHMAAGWAWAFNTPFSWVKQVASHFGGTRQGMAISWPKVITDKGGIRNQFHHVVDIAPTLLEAARLRPPKAVDGIAQSPIEGVSLLYTFDAKNANAPSAHKTQYFEMMGDHAIYNDGWIAGTKVIRPPWDTSLVAGINDDPTKRPWELFDLRSDWTQSEDVAARQPAKLKEMQALFWKEAKKYHVEPLDASGAGRLLAPRPGMAAGRNVFTWTQPLTGIPAGDAPSVLNASYKFRVEVETPSSGAKGMLVTQGGRFGGYGFYVLKGKPVFTWNPPGQKRVKWEGGDVLGSGRHVLEFDFKYDGLGVGTLAFGSVSGVGRGGLGVLKVDGKLVAQQRVDRTPPVSLQRDEGLDVGSDTGTPVDDQDYQVPFAFTGRLLKVTLTVDRPKLTPADEKALRQAQPK